MERFKQFSLRKTLPTCALMIALVAGFGASQVEARTLHYATPAPPDGSTHQ